MRQEAWVSIACISVFLLTIVNGFPRTLATAVAPCRMKVLVIGSGGREHALVWSIARSPRVSEVVCAPGNAGIAQLARCVPASQKDLNDLLRVVLAESPDLVVVGPELPLSLGLVDELQRRSIAAFGPTQKAANSRAARPSPSGLCSGTKFLPRTTPSPAARKRHWKPSSSSTCRW